MLNKKLCAGCNGNFEKKLDEKDRQIENLKSLINAGNTEIKILDNELHKDGLSIMVIKHDSKYNRPKDISAKVREESLELQNAIKFGDHESIVDESLDVITVCLNAINQQVKWGVDIKFAIELHQQKLKDRGWEAEKVLSFVLSREES